MYFQSFFNIPLAVPSPPPILKPYNNPDDKKSYRIWKDWIKIMKKMWEYENILPKCWKIKKLALFGGLFLLLVDFKRLRISAD